MTDFIIRVVADPSRAVQNVGTVEKAIASAEGEAIDLRKAIVDAFAVRDAGISASIDKVSDRLRVARDHAHVTQAELAALGGDIPFSAVNKFNRELDETERKATGLRQIFGGIFAGITAGAVLREFVQLSDTATNLRNKLSAVTKSESELVSVQGELLAASNRTRSSFEGAITVFSRLAANREQLNRSNIELIGFTESLQKAIALSGATAQEAENGLIQLSQGLAAGALRGDELRSVLEQLPAVADVIAKGLGVTRGELRKMGEQGAITSKVILESFEKARQELDDKFAKTIPTVGQSFQVLKNNTIELVGGFNDATHASQGLSLAIQFIGNNLGPASIVVSSFATLIGVNLAAQAIPAAIAALSKLGIAVTAGAGPFIALGAAALTATTYVAGLIDAQNKAVEAANKQLEEDSAFGSIGTQIRQARKELDALNKQISLSYDGTATEAQAKRQAELTARIEQYSNASKNAAQTQREQDALTVRQSESLKALVRELDQEATTLSLSNSEQEIRKQLLKEVDELRKKGIDLDKAGNESIRDELEAMLRRNQELSNQSKILDSIRGPQEKYRQDVAALTALLEQGRITQEEFNQALVKAKPNEGKDSFEGQLQALREQNAELEIKAENEGAVEVALLAELELRRAGVTVTEEQSAALLEAAKRQEELNKKIADQKSGVKQESIDDRKEERALEALRKRIDTTGQFALEEQRLQDLLAKEPGLAQEIGQAVADLRLRQLEASKELSDGFERAFIKISREAEDLASVAERVVGVFADDLTNAITEFAETGKFSFKDFARSVLSDITKIVTRLLIVQLIQAATGLGGGGGGSAAGSIAGAGLSAAGAGGLDPEYRAGGGPVDPNKPYVVGEQGPEILFPKKGGTVMPADKTAAFQAGAAAAAAAPPPPPQVNLTTRVTNVVDPKLVARTISDGLATNEIINVIGDNREQIRQLLAN